MFEGHDQAIYDLLAERRLVPPVSLQAAWAEHRASHVPFGRLLIEQGLLAGPVLLRAVAEHTGCDYAAELPATLPGEAIAVIAAGLARTRGVAPLAANATSVTVAALDPFRADLAGELTFAVDRQVRVCVADPERVRLLIRQHYGEGDGSLDEAFADLQAQMPGAGREALTDSDIEQLASQTPVIRFVNAVLARAISERASDIHFEPFENEFRIRYRVDGALGNIPPPPQHFALPVISRLKVLANLNIAERRVPQDGRIKLNLGGRSVDLRISTLPTQFGESVVLRVLDQSAVRLAVGELGLPDSIRAGVEQAIRRPNGIFVVTGPTGAGKTTTLYACLQASNAVDTKLLTVEDPVEYEIDGVMQVPVNPAAGLTFGRALRTFLRQDPDVVMVGEIRDLETAQIAIQASLTGHLVLTTLHTNDAPSAVTRFLDLGIEPFLLGSTLEAVLAQRLLRRVCRMCRVPYTPDDALWRQLGMEVGTVEAGVIHRAAGCPACQQTGYRGRFGIFEFLPMNEALRDLIAAGASLAELRREAIDQGMIPLREAAVAALLAGETTVEEVLKYT
jgi:type IV pilus assembly protein PilB